MRLTKDGKTATPETQLSDGCHITYEKSERRATTVSDALVAVGFEPPSATSRVSAQILVNSRPVDFTAPVKNGDTLAVQLRPLGGLMASGFRPGAANNDTNDDTDNDTKPSAPAPAAEDAEAPKADAKKEDASSDAHHGLNSLAEALGLTAEDAGPATHAEEAPVPKKTTISISDLMRDD